MGDVAYGWALEDTTGLLTVHADLAGRILAAHAIGPHASTLIQPLMQAATFGQRAIDVARGQYWIHPALAEVVENALLGLPFPTRPERRSPPARRSGRAAVGEAVDPADRVGHHGPPLAHLDDLRARRRGAGPSTRSRSVQARSACARTAPVGSPSRWNSSRNGMPAGRRSSDSSGSSTSAHSQPVSSAQNRTSASCTSSGQSRQTWSTTSVDPGAHLLVLPVPRGQAERQPAGRAEDEHVVADRPDPGGAQALRLGGRGLHVVDVEVEVDAAGPSPTACSLSQRVAERRQQGGELVVLTPGRRTTATR